MEDFKLSAPLESEFVRIQPLKKEDFETLYKVACDPLIWEQHPNKDRYKREVFEVFFEGALQSGAAFLVIDIKTNEVIGSSRFYGLDPVKKSVSIGYTFLARDHWGSTYNHDLKKMMIRHAFKIVDSVVFHIGAGNIRSQKAIEKLGAEKIGEAEIGYYGETTNHNFIYEVKK